MTGGSPGAHSRSVLVLTPGQSWCRLQVSPGADSRSVLMLTPGQSWCRLQVSPGADSRSVLMLTPGQSWCRLQVSPGADSRSVLMPTPGQSWCWLHADSKTETWHTRAIPVYYSHLAEQWIKTKYEHLSHVPAIEHVPSSRSSDTLTVNPTTILY